MADRAVTFTALASIGLAVAAADAWGVAAVAARSPTAETLRRALSLPPGPERDAVVALTYGVVVFSIFGQGPTIGRITRESLSTG